MVLPQTLSQGPMMMIDVVIDHLAAGMIIKRSLYLGKVLQLARKKSRENVDDEVESNYQ